MKQYLGIIGGSGLYSMKDFVFDERLTIDTPYGLPSTPLMAGKLAGVDCVFLARHGEGHVFSPSEVNFRANIWAMKKVGVKAIFSVSAVGSLREDIHPGHMVVIDQYIDRTKIRPSTFFEKGIVAHVSMARPVSQYLRELLIASCRSLKITYHEKGTYVCIEGPQFSTMAESHFYRSLGAAVVGMTNLQEAKLAREAEIDYATLALSTDYDCWHPDHDHVTVDQVVAVVRANALNAQRILADAVKKFDFSKKLECEGILKGAIMTHHEYIKPDVIKRLEPIIGKYF
ncbi:MAG: S-methyl-5'-thioadenosine phosphorylase [Deltaproteobacteria bacterium]|nr:S-methyl-5'-thioadenosine phosphorylase [Deltaproteobacteria bacterium]